MTDKEETKIFQFEGSKYVIDLETLAQLAALSEDFNNSHEISTRSASKSKRIIHVLGVSEGRSRIDESATPLPNQESTDKVEEEYTCVMCLEEFKAAQMFRGGCKCAKGAVCLRCVSTLANSTAQKTSKADVPCPICNTPYSLLSLKKLMSITSFYTLFDRRIRQETSQLPTVAWCPTRNCETALTRKNSIVPEGAALTPENCVCPVCTQEFCMSCLKPWHKDSGCDVPQRDHQRDEEETERWKRTNTHPCPKCRSPIIGAGGTARAQCYNCNHIFCYVCGSNWSSKHVERTSLWGCTGRSLSNPWDFKTHRCERVTKAALRGTVIVIGGVVIGALILAVSPVVLLVVGTIRLTRKICSRFRRQRFHR